MLSLLYGLALSNCCLESSEYFVLSGRSMCLLSLRSEMVLSLRGYLKDPLE